MWMIATFIVGYAVFCMMAVPDGRRSERQYAKLPGAMSAILFLPLHIGKLTAYAVAAVIMQIGNFALHIAALIMKLTAASPEVFKSVLGYGFGGFILISVITAIVLEKD